MTARSPNEPGDEILPRFLACVAIVVAFLFAPGFAAAQRADAAISFHAVRFFFVERGARDVPVPIDPSRLPVLRARIAVDLDGVPLGEALRIIARRSGLTFVYAETAIRAEKLVHLRAQDITVAAALTEVLLDASVDVILRPGGSAVLVPSTRAIAEDVSGTVRDSLNSRPISGAVVMLLDSSRTVLARNITDERGRYRVSARANALHLRVVRIGFQPRELGLDRPGDSVRSLDVAMVRFSTALAPVRVTDNTRCPTRSGAAATAALWEQARAGLLATVVAREANPAKIYRFAFERTFDGGSDRITRFLVFADSATAALKSFTAVSSAQEFVKAGFSKDSAGIQILFAPDADVLLDEAFSAGYCFRVAEPVSTRPHELGLSFTSAERVHGRLDIDGTLWLDTAARALRDIEFRYVGLPARTEPFHPGGLISFRQMANGTTLIDRWMLRRVDVDQDTTRDGSNVSVRYWQYATENGGELARADWPDGRSWRASFGSIEVHALSSEGKPVTGARLALAGTTYRGVTDSAGNASIRELIPGPYALEFIDPRLAHLGLSIPTSLKFTAARDSVIRATVKIPTAEEYVFEKCFPTGHYTVGSNWVLVAGRVLTSDDKPINNARMSFNLRGAFKTSTDGVFEFCAHHLAGVDSLVVSVGIDDGNAAPLRVTDVSVDITEPLTVVPIKIGAVPPVVLKRP